MIIHFGVDRKLSNNISGMCNLHPYNGHQPSFVHAKISIGNSQVQSQHFFSSVFFNQQELFHLSNSGVTAGADHLAPLLPQERQNKNFSLITGQVCLLKGRMSCQ